MNSSGFRQEVDGVNKSKKKVVLIICVTVFLVSVIFAAIGIARHISHQRELRAEEAEQRELAETYLRLNYAFGIAGAGWADLINDIGIEWALESAGEYWPFHELNQFGIRFTTYLILKKYELETGNTLSHDTVIDYFSEEFEPDGSLRLYNNGRHPEIQAFVEWMWEGMRLGDMLDFVDYVHRMIYLPYFRDKRVEGFQPPIFDRELNPQMLDAIFRAYSDPDYVLDLTSLLKAGY